MSMKRNLDLKYKMFLLFPLLTGLSWAILYYGALQHLGFSMEWKIIASAPEIILCFVYFFGVLCNLNETTRKETVVTVKLFLLMQIQIYFFLCIYVIRGIWKYFTQPVPEKKES